MHTHTLYNAICICLCMLQCSLNEKGQPVLKILRKLDVAFDIVAFQVHIITSCHYVSIMCMYHYKFKKVINFWNFQHARTQTHTHTHIHALMYSHTQLLHSTFIDIRTNDVC